MTQDSQTMVEGLAELSALNLPDEEDQQFLAAMTEQLSSGNYHGTGMNLPEAWTLLDIEETTGAQISLTEEVKRISFGYAVAGGGVTALRLYRKGLTYLPR